MAGELRRFTRADLPRVLALSLAAWAPVFASIEAQLAGSGVFELQHPDWRAGQRRAVEAVCTHPDHAVWVAEVDGDVAGFAAAAVHADDAMGEIVMIAVDPAHQRTGLGRALTRAALGWFTDQGLTTAVVETGGDPGHEPARRTYEDAGFTPLPVVRYFTALVGPPA